MSTGTYQTEINVPYRGVDQDILINVHYEAIPACPCRSFDGRGGPPLEPDEPARIEIDCCYTVDGNREICLTSAQEGEIEYLIAQHLAEQECCD